MTPREAGGHMTPREARKEGGIYPGGYLGRVYSTGYTPPGHLSRCTLPPAVR